jgi:Tfp pilus assembly protein FimT
MLELMVVLMILATGFLIMLPKMTAGTQRTSVRAARDQLATMISIARSTSVASGTSAGLYFRGDSVWVSRTTAGSAVTVLRGVKFTTQYGVTLSHPVDSIVYSLRGIATNLSASQKFKFTRGTNKDSVCVNKLGLVEKTCGL